jgi:hypothetical protein
MNWAFQQIENHELNASQRLVFLALAHKHHNETRQCTPSVETIAKMTGRSKRRAQMNVRKLEEKQLVLVVKRFEKGFQLSNQYLLLGVTKKTPLSKLMGVTGESPDKEVTTDMVIDDGELSFPSQEKKLGDLVA